MSSPARLVLQVLVGLVSLALLIYGAAGLFFSLLPVGGAACSPGAVCWDTRGLSESIGLTYLLVGAVSMSAAIGGRPRGGRVDARASVAIGAVIAVVVGLLAPVWGPPQLPLDLAFIRLVVVAIASVVARLVIGTRGIVSGWPWTLGAYGVVRLILLQVNSGSTQHVTDDILWWWLSLGLVPIVMGALLYPLESGHRGRAAA